jgi:Lipocalin-like domain
MDQLKWSVIVALLLIAVPPSFADNQAKIFGIWKMVSMEWEVQETGDRVPFIMVMNPAGYLIYTPEGRMMTIVTREGRKPSITTQDRAKLFDTMSAFTGMYRLEGDKCIIKVNVASAPE